MAFLPRTGRLLRWIFLEDLGLKFMCLLLAGLLWFYIDGELMSQKEFELPVRPADLARSESLELASPRNLPVFIVRVRGPRRLIEFWQNQNLRFKRRLLDNPRPGRNPLNPQPGDVDAENFAVVSVMPKDPGGAAVTLIPTAIESRPVRVRIRGQPKEGFLAGKPLSNPVQVKIKGSDNDLALITEVWTDEVDISGAEQDVNAEVAVTPNVEVDGHTINFSPTEKVRVTVPVTPVVVVRQSNFEVRALVPPGLAMTVEPQSVNVELAIEAPPRNVDIEEIRSRVKLYVEWPAFWERPKDSKTVLGPAKVQIKFSAPTRVFVRGVNSGPLPEVQITGALAGELK